MPARPASRAPLLGSTPPPGFTLPRGFTLIETIIVLVILGLVAGLVIGRGPMRSPTVELRSTATTLLQGLRSARAAAIATDTDTAFILDPAQHAWQVGSGQPRIVPRAVQLQLSVGGKPATAITFAPDGSSTGGAVSLANQTRRMEVTVDWLTGRMAVHDLTP